MSTAAAESHRALSLSGFGTLGYVETDSREATYRTGRAADGANSSGAFDVDSRLGVQLDAGFTTNLSGTLQVLARQDGDGDFSPDLEWAFLQSQLNDSIGLRIGRIVAPIFSVSDSREVGFSNTLLRPPEDTYVQVPVRSVNGIDLIGHFELGNSLLAVQAFAGRSTDEFYDNLTIDTDKIIGFNAVVEQGIARIRVTHSTARSGTSSTELNQLGESLETAAELFPDLQQAAVDFNGEQKSSSFSGIGIDLDFDKAFVSGEFTRRRVNSFLADTTGWYVAAGYRWNSFTPYAYVSALRQDSKTLVEFPDVPQLMPAAIAANRQYNSVDQDSVALGMRWDFADNLAFKFQLEQIKRAAVGLNFYRAADPLTEGGDDIRLVSLGIDFIF